MKSENKEDIGKNVIQIDFCYTYTGEEDRWEKPVQDKVVERQDQHGTVLVMTSSETKAIHAVPVPSKGSASLRGDRQICSGEFCPGRLRHPG